MVGMGFGFGLFGIFFVLMFILVFGIIIFNIVRSVGQWNKSNNSPRLTVSASVVAKRMAVHHHHHGGTDHSMSHTSTFTHYYVTFQVESGDRFELYVGGSDYGMLAEGDRGKLTFQGTRFLGFDRQF